jgi:hypothetical protein
MSEQAAREEAMAAAWQRTRKHVITGANWEAGFDAGWAACEARVREHPLAEVEAQAEVLDMSPERI